jgi:Transposase domain (DUF772)
MVKAGREVQLNLASRWFYGLVIDDNIPDYSAFSHARNERFSDSDILRGVFERGVGACIAAALVGGEGFAVDANLLQADANKNPSIPGSLPLRRQLDLSISSNGPAQNPPILSRLPASSMALMAPGPPSSARQSAHG